MTPNYLSGDTFWKSVSPKKEEICNLSTAKRLISLSERRVMRPSRELCVNFSLARRIVGSGSPLVLPCRLRLEITYALELGSILSVVPCRAVDELSRGRGTPPQISADVCKQHGNPTGQCGDRSGPRFVAASAPAQIVRCHARDHGRASDLTDFLSHLAVRQHVAPATQNQALQAILFLYRVVLEIDLPWLTDEVRAPLRQRLLYGTGMRLSECLQLRVKDLEFTRLEIIVRSGKGDKDRITVLPQSLLPPLHAHLQRLRLGWRCYPGSRRSAAGDNAGGHTAKGSAPSGPSVLTQPMNSSITLGLLPTAGVRRAACGVRRK